MSTVPSFLVILITVFAIVDPIGTLPFYVALTDPFTPVDRGVILRRAVLVAGGVLSLFALLGRFLFVAFGFSLGAFEIAGGILLFVVAYDMLQGEITRTRVTPQGREEVAARRDEVAVVPLGIPLLAGPGAISTVMIYEGASGSQLWVVLATFVAILITAAATYFIFRYGERILRAMGRVGVMAMTRVLGLILAAVGVQFVLAGISSALPHL